MVRGMVQAKQLVPYSSSNLHSCCVLRTQPLYKPGLAHKSIVVCAYLRVEQGIGLG